LEVNSFLKLVELNENRGFSVSSSAWYRASSEKVACVFEILFDEQCCRLLSGTGEDGNKEKASSQHQITKGANSS
jgi:hypothetical protein